MKRLVQVRKVLEYFMQGIVIILALAVFSIFTLQTGNWWNLPFIVILFGGALIWSKPFREMLPLAAQVLVVLVLGTYYFLRYPIDKYRLGTYQRARKTR